MATKVHVFDTSALIWNPNLLKHTWGEIFIPAAVLKQLDRLKSSGREGVSYNARVASQNIEGKQRKGRVTIVTDYANVNMLDNDADNQVVGTALWLKQKGYKPILVTTDRNMRIAAGGCGLRTENGHFNKKIPWLYLTAFLFLPGGLFSFLWKATGDDSITIIMAIAYYMILLFVIGSTRTYGPGDYDDYFDNPVINPGYADWDGNIWYSRK